jgi:NADH dehydrogenase
VIAIGLVTNFFNIDGIAHHAFGIKSLQEVEKFTGHIREEIITNKHLDKNYFVIGAGQTGVELAASLSEELTSLTNSNIGIHGKVRLTVVEADNRVAPRLSHTASKLIKKRLSALNIKVLTKHKVTSLDNEDIMIDGRKRPTETAIWTSGVANHPFFSQHKSIFSLAKNGRVIVDEHLMACQNIYVLGDNNNVKYSGTARPAYDQAEFLAKHMERLESHQPQQAFHPHVPPCAVPVGRNWAYVEYYGIYVAGRTGYALRRLIELSDYTKILPFALAVKTWRKHALRVNI